MKATVFYIVVYLFMNLAAFAVVVARERETGAATTSPRSTGSAPTGRWLAWPMTIAMLALAGFPATAGFFGKIYLIEAAVDNDYAWLGVLIVIGSAISLAYYLRVVAAVWMRSPDEAPEPPRGARRPPGDGRRRARGRRGPGRARRRGAPGAPRGRRGHARRPGAGVGRSSRCCSSRSSARRRRSSSASIPDPLLDFAGKAGAALSNLL